MLFRSKPLESQIKTYSSNSSKPPSSDPSWQPAPPSKPRSGKKPGGQPGHAGAFRQRLPLERVKRIVDYIPETCRHCLASQNGQQGPHEPETSWHQVAELPEVLAEITEHRGHQRTCGCCGKVTRAEMSASLAEQHTVVLEAVRAVPVKNVDETGWSKNGKPCWL